MPRRPRKRTMGCSWTTTSGTISAKRRRRNSRNRSRSKALETYSTNIDPRKIREQTRGLKREPTGRNNKRTRKRRKRIRLS